jgi:hypothetical protein
MPDPDRHRGLPAYDVQEQLLGYCRHEEARGIHQEAGQGVAQDEFGGRTWRDDDSGSIHARQFNHDERGDYDNPREDTPEHSGLTVVGAVTFKMLDDWNRPS